jgi:hypothetical protein
MDNRNRLRLLSLEMEMQRAWLAAYMEDGEARAERRRNSVMWRIAMSIMQSRPLWIAAFSMAAKWWRRRKVPTR